MKKRDKGNVFFESDFMSQFVSYFFVGGCAAVVEWGMFYFFANVIDMHYILATCLAFVFSTTANWILGRFWTFKDDQKYVEKRLKEIALVFGVSAIGLLFNMMLMFLFVSVFRMDTKFLKTVAKIVATGIVFFWNFLIRKFFIYGRERG